MTFVIEGVTYTKAQVWDWLKAENHYRPPKEQLQRIPNRVMRRRAA